MTNEEKILATLEKLQAEVTKNMKSAFESGIPLAICSVVYYEVMRGFKVAGSSRQMQKFLQLYQNQKWANLPRVEGLNFVNWRLQ